MAASYTFSKLRRLAGKNALIFIMSIFYFTKFIVGFATLDCKNTATYSAAENVGQILQLV